MKRKEINAVLYFLTFQVGCTLLGAPLTIDTSRNDAAGIARSLATREKTLQADVHQVLRVAKDAYRRRRARLDANHDSLVGQEAMTLAAKVAESLL